MTDDIWFDIMGRLAPRTPVTLDDLTAGHSGQTARPGGWLARRADDPWLVPPGVLWAESRETTACIGIRVSEPLANIAQVAAKLAAIGSERKVRPIIFSELGSCGLEQFGFRVERLAGASQTERATCEAELMSFWDISIVIDAEQINDLG